MANKDQKKQDFKSSKKTITRSKEDLELKDRILASPELFITEKGSDEHLDRLTIKLKLIGGDEFILSDFVAEVMAAYESKFSKAWYYRLADLYSVDRSIMDKYVKPEFVRQFTIQFIYGRFPYMMLRTLRSKNRKTSKGNDRSKLFQHLTKTASGELDIVIEQVFEMMGTCKSPIEFKMKYSSEYKIYFQLELDL